MTKVKMSFDPSIAKDVGTDSAILFSNIDYWVDINRANKRNFHDGKYWTYNSIKAFMEQFTWLSESQIKTCLKKLEDNNYLLSGNHNESRYDRTKWYTVIYNESISYLPQMDDSFNANTLDDNSQPIPDNKPIENHIGETPSLFSEKDNSDTSKIEETETIKKPSKKNKIEPAVQIYFRDCKWNDYLTLKHELAEDEDFRKQFAGVDLRSYIEDALAWSEKGNTTTELGWYMTLRQWMRRDLKNGNLKKLPDMVSVGFKNQ